MSRHVTLGGERLGSGKKLKVELHGYERSTHDLSYLWRSTMSSGTLVPFMSEVALPGDTFDINLDCDIKTHPTIGPLFGSYKVQLDVFLCPIRLYNSLLHNNKLGIGLTMNKVFLPTIELKAPQKDLADSVDIDNEQINPSCILAYLGLRGVGNQDVDPDITRTFNGVPLLCYWDIYKNYYANKMEEVGYVIHNGGNAGGPVMNAAINGSALPSLIGLYMGSASDEIRIQWNSAVKPNLEYIIFNTSQGEIYALDLGVNWVDDTAGPYYSYAGFNAARWGQLDVYSFRIAGAGDAVPVSPTATAFTLANIDSMREEILSFNSLVAPFDINSVGNPPYSWVADATNAYILSSQEGLGLKTYQSDMFNNWLNTEYIDGPTGINAITAIDTSGGSFNIDTLNLSKKVYDMLNRVAVSGGTYEDWLEAVYDHDHYRRAETPMYMGGLIKELVFQEVISNTQAEGQPLGTLAGRGILGKKHKGGDIYIKVDEPSYIMGIVSLTPRIDYSQGNKWDMHLRTLDDLHKPALDQIGFQDLITEQLAWWDTDFIGGPGGDWEQKSAGKQPAWLNYMTNVNRNFGNFAISTNEMFMTLNRRYEYDSATRSIADLTSYIDPVKFNFIFAETALDAQNFWTQIAVNITARRKMSAKVMPNL